MSNMIKSMSKKGRPPMKCCGRHMVLKSKETKTLNDQGVETGVSRVRYWMCEKCGKTRLA